MINKNLDGKTVLVSGASRGIGRAIAVLLAENGAKVAVNYLANKREAEDVVGEIRNNGGEGAIFCADVGDATAVQIMFEEIERQLGPVDIIVSNATAPIDYKNFVDISWDNFASHLETQIHGAFNLTKAALPGMIERKKGNIIHIITTATLGVPPTRMSGYITAKYGLLGLTRVLATELGGYGIRVNAVSPGFVETDLTRILPEKYRELVGQKTPLGRNTTPEDVAEIVLFLAREESAHISGAHIPVCGGSAM